MATIGGTANSLVTNNGSAVSTANATPPPPVAKHVLVAHSDTEAHWEEKGHKGDHDDPAECAEGLMSLTTCVSTSGQPAPIPDQVLTAIDATHAKWKTPAASGGSVTSVSVVSANGFAGTVANPTTTPAITMTTSASGVLKGVAGAVSAAVSGTDYEVPTNKNIANGYAGLDAGGKVSTSVLPALAITDTFVVASQAAQTALIAEVGDVAVRTDQTKTYILKTAPASIFANWQELLTPGAVQSVNGFTGIVVLAANDIGLGNVDNTSDANKPVSTAQQTALNLKADKTTTIGTGNGLTGGGDLSTNRTLTAVANPDGSIAVDGNGIGVGVLYSDAQHGVRGGGTQHALATSTTAGFESAADKATFDIIASTYQTTNEKAQPNGYASLGVDGKIPNSQIPAVAITDTFVVASQAAQTALAAQTGDVAIRTDQSKSYILATEPASIFANWQELLSPGASGFVDITTAQTITGQKTFTATVLANAGITTGGNSTLGGGSGSALTLDSVIQATSGITAGGSAINAIIFANNTTARLRPLDSVGAVGRNVLIFGGNAPLGFGGGICQIRGGEAGAATGATPGGPGGGANVIGRTGGAANAIAGAGVGGNTQTNAGAGGNGSSAFIGAQGGTVFSFAAPGGGDGGAGAGRGGDQVYGAGPGGTSAGIGAKGGDVYLEGGENSTGLAADNGVIYIGTVTSPATPEGAGQKTSIVNIGRTSNISSNVYGGNVNIGAAVDIDINADGTTKLGGNGTTLIKSANTFPVTIEAHAASTWKTTTGALSIDGRGSLSLGSSGGGDVNVDSDATVNIGGGGSVLIKSANTHPLTIEAHAASTWRTTTGILNVDGRDGLIFNSSGAGNISFNTAGDVDIDAGALVTIGTSTATIVRFGKTSNVTQLVSPVDYPTQATPANPPAGTIRSYTKNNAGVLEFHLLYPDGTDNVVNSH